MNSELQRSYARCRAINRRHGQTYYRSTALLPRDVRPHVHALYAFCRHADDIVDDLNDASVPARAAALQAFGTRFRHDLAIGRSDHEVLAAVVDTVRRYEIAPQCFDRFLHSMEMDLSIAQYDTFEDLCGYMDGSAAVIGEMMMPVLGTRDADAIAPARGLGIAFQLTNFLRDVGEDLGRGRVYIPQEDLRRFGADPELRRVTPEWRSLMQFEIQRTRAIYASADIGLALLPPRAARCIVTARTLYSEILERIERNDYDVFTRRASVPAARKLSVALGAMVSPRRRERTGNRNPNGSAPVA